MAPLSIQSGVKYARALVPEPLRRSVNTVQTTISRHFLSPAQSRSFAVCSRTLWQRQVLVASSLDDLLDQAAMSFVRSFVFLTLVLEEDGTVVDSEDFFQTLPDNTALMVLQEGEMWAQNKISPSFRQPKRNEIAKLTFDLYKLHPKDFLCCLGVKATLYEMYSLSYDFRCTTVKQVLRSVLRCFSHLSRLVGQLLLYTSSSILQFTGEGDC
ncbi:cell death activator CIDE-A [Echeneis naucrates]|uniref:cell death activator CIDE-A n=1 Tax=Echeneis naucrates TaxID=173247 RepID=UPI0011146135|nr:cell death activator CIDE-A-like [Echeneis naucrates]